MTSYAADLIRPLNTAENQFLQILLSRFSLKRRPEGALLELHFDDTSPAIWTKQAKDDIKSKNRDFKRKCKRYQAQLDSFLLNHYTDSFEYNDPLFPDICQNHGRNMNTGAFTTI